MPRAGMMTAAGLLLAGAAWLSAQTPAPQGPPAPPQQRPPVFRAGVDVVQLDFTVLDADRRPVRGLKAEDFEVREDGDVQPIVTVEEVSLTDREEPEPVWARAVVPDVATNDLEDRRLIAIVMDDRRCCSLPGGGGAARASDRWAIANAVETALRLIDRLRPRDLALVAHTRDPIPIDHFTADRDALVRSVRRFRPISEGDGCLPQHRPWLGDLVSMMASAPQPLKAVIVLRSVAGADTRAMIPCPMATVRNSDTGRVTMGPAPPSGGRDLDFAENPNVPIYYMNVGGLTVDPSLMRDHGPNASGGRNIDATNDLLPHVDEILSENESYYVIGFRTDRPTSDGHYRRVEVRVKGHKDYVVRSRRTYRRPLPPPTPGSRRDRDPELPPLPNTVAKLLPSFDVTVEATAAAFKRPDGPGAVLAVTVDAAHPVPADATSNLDYEDLDLRTVLYESGAPRQDLRDRLRLNVTPGASRMTATLRSAVNVTAGDYELWLTVRDPRTTRLGSVSYDIVVPDFGEAPVSLSSVVVGTQSSEGAALPPAVAKLVPIVPLLSREFGRTEQVTAFLQVYQGTAASLSPVTVTMRLVDAAGTVAHEQREELPVARFNANRTAEVRPILPLAQLAPGQYLLSFEARAGIHVSSKRDLTLTVR